MTNVHDLLVSENAALFKRFRSALNLPDEEKHFWRITNAFVALVVRYSETHRRYHTLQHVKLLFAAWDLVKEQVPLELHQHVELAIFYHDAVYDPVSYRNEEESYQLFKRDFGSLFDEFFLAEVASCIRGTVHDGELDEDAIAARWMADIDLLSLSLIPDLFDQNSVMLKAEYAHHPHFTEKWWREGQNKFFSPMLSRPHLYYNEIYRGETEQNARNNLKRLLA